MGGWQKVGVLWRLSTGFGGGVADSPSGWGNGYLTSAQEGSSGPIEK
jgi:hypothetical protein